MFEVGKGYEFRMLEGDGDVRFWGVVEKYEHPLIKLEDTTFTVQIETDLGGLTGGSSTHIPGQIINVTSPSFVSAVRKD